MRNKIILYLTFLYFILLTFYSSSIPFFWDNTVYSELSNYFFSNGYKNISAPLSIDIRGFYFYQLYMSIAWNIFGKTLMVSHFAILPFLIGIAYEFYKLSKRFLSPKMIPYALILLMLEPTFNTQSILMGYDIITLYFFLLSVNFLLNGKEKLLYLSLLMLGLSNFRGLFLVASIFIIQQILFYQNNKTFKAKFILYYVPSFIAFIAWAVFHKINAGWYFFSPNYIENGERAVSTSMMLKQFLFIIWKINDFGRVILWLVLIIGSFILYKNYKLPNDFKRLIYLLIIPLLITSSIMVGISNPIGHKYFMFTYLILIIAVCSVLERMKSPLNFYGSLILISSILITGNFWLYPERLGNGWDSSLKIIPYFEMKNKMDNYNVENKITPSSIGTQFPLISDKRFSDLQDTSFQYTNVWRGPISNYNYFLQTNVINTDIADQIEEVKTNWVLLKELKSGVVYLRLYKKTEIPH